MHEWALAEAIISAVSQIAERGNLRAIKEVTLRIGELQQIDREILKFALSQMASGKLAGVKFRMKLVRARFKCRVCGHKWTFNENSPPNHIKEAIHFIPEVAYAHLRCPRCSSPDFEISGGRGIWISSVRGVK
ncbi:hydrogenase nickel incorporation protein HypA [Candidatus Bathyarchaeota archaeon]|nr:hydrogenase nickel incorporation protein HypA [Candidatus Bathyarchaeota archaeon]